MADACSSANAPLFACCAQRHSHSYNGAQRSCCTLQLALARAGSLCQTGQESNTAFVTVYLLPATSLCGWPPRDPAKCTLAVAPCSQPRKQQRMTHEEFLAPSIAICQYRKPYPLPPLPPGHLPTYLPTYLPDTARRRSPAGTCWKRQHHTAQPCGCQFAFPLSHRCALQELECAAPARPLPHRPANPPSTLPTRRTQGRQAICLPAADRLPPDMAGVGGGDWRGRAAPPPPHWGFGTAAARLSVHQNNWILILPQVQCVNS